jgi:hypothetical protein
MKQQQQLQDFAQAYATGTMENYWEKYPIDLGFSTATEFESPFALSKTCSRN